MSNRQQTKKPNKAPEPTSLAVTPRADVTWNAKISRLSHAARQRGPWLIFDVGRKAKESAVGNELREKTSEKRKKARRWSLAFVVIGALMIVRALSYSDLGEVRASGTRNAPISGWAFLAAGTFLVIGFSYAFYRSRD